MTALGFATVLGNCIGVFGVFLMLGSVLVLADRRRGRVHQSMVAT